VGPCFGEEIFAAFEAPTEFDGADIGEFSAIGGGGDLEGDAPAFIGHGLYGDALDFDFI
jgi:hypothetical protein